MTGLLRQLLFLLVLPLMLSACYGEFELNDDGNGGPAFIGSTGTKGDSDEEEPPGPAFHLVRENVMLLPFDTRMNKLSAVVGVPVEDPMFGAIHAKRFELGDHDFAQGIQPDLTWNATKMSLWVDGLKDVCSSQAMRDRYPFLPEHLNEMAVAAYGREVGAEDLAIYEDVLANMSFDEDTKYRTVCLALLSSSEFVAR